jgi:3-oxoadipate enol-lactonase
MPTTEANGVQLRYEIDGPSDAPVLALSNSLGTDVSMWAPQLPAFAKRFRVVRYDSRGHGASGITPGPYTIEQLARDALALLDRLGIERVHFCGLSMGGMVGMWLGVSAPQRINKLVLCNTAARIGPPELWNTRIENVRKGGMEAIANAVLERWFTAAFRARGASTIEPVRRTLVATPPDGYIACCAAVRDMDQREAIARVRAPTLVIAGAHDAATPPEDGRFLAEKIPGAKYVELEAAHLSNLEVADEFSDAVLRFLGE